MSKTTQIMLLSVSSFSVNKLTEKRNDFSKKFQQIKLKFEIKNQTGFFLLHVLSHGAARKHCSVSLKFYIF